MYELADDRFGSYLGQFKDSDGIIVSAMVYSYESQSALYDVIIMSEDQKKWYRKNMRKWLEVSNNKIFGRIESHFEL